MQQSFSYCGNTFIEEASAIGSTQLTDAEFDLVAIFLMLLRRILGRDEVMGLLKGMAWSPLNPARQARRRDRAERLLLAVCGELLTFGRAAH